MWNGLIELPLWGYIVVALIATHLTILSVTLYLHRGQAHRGVDFHPALAHFFRFWVWFTTGMQEKEWVAVHRKHHAKVETAEDPHSPQILGLRRVLLEGSEIYGEAIQDPAILETYGRGTADDRLERRLYSRYRYAGVTLLGLICVGLFGVYGVTLFAVLMLWIPVLAAGVINGLGHHSGYRNYSTADASTNLSPVGLLIGGEELHNNHHAFPSSAKFAIKRWEFDIGWVYLRLFAALGLARIRRVAPEPVTVPGKRWIDGETVAAVVRGRMHIMAGYYRYVIVPVVREARQRAHDADYRQRLKEIKRLLSWERHDLDARAKEKAQALHGYAGVLPTVIEYRERLAELWSRTNGSQERLQQVLQEWCSQAETTGIHPLEEFATYLRSFNLRYAV